MLEQLSFFDLINDINVAEEIDNQDTSIYENWLLIDGNNLLNRCYYATAINPDKLMTAPDGVPVNGVNGFLRTMLNQSKKLNARPVVFFDDGKGFRKELYPEYKNGRNETPEPLETQFPVIREILEKSSIAVYSSKTYEADDLIASFVKIAKKHVYILSNDKDLYQLINENCTVIARKGKEDLYITPSQFKELYDGLVPEQIIDLKAIAGDSSDNIPGIRGISEKGAIKLLLEFETLDKILETTEFPQNLNRYRNKIAEGKENGIFARQLTKLVDNVELDVNEINMDTEILRSYCRKLKLNRIMQML
ncbi:5'-3' exonuclease [Rummeliibacillus stabekisii]|uniref:5'-3' exonuclease n=1 Tax=Rummeliibacillus stabekisii TaxID=241244 RepID=UPI003724B08D